MTTTIGITLNVLLDTAILGLLAFVMSRAAKLTPHHQSVPEDRRAVVGTLPSQRSPMPRRHSSTYQTATAIRTPRGMTKLRIDPVRK
jgi:hypothetical protein